eukprot:CAMPEP_0196751376 /NCGR_PEP_ID=MMETSP1091-20130531/83547_1 /TAXON_ID=302021 /ORGANISM="Rhodomonas sp., Strain CCMP768" /LENGTH=76 /DNA_ID=CAMNT_0042099159 /DNA_START=73 /DNA_END=299 /DNA_ORIENTATION=+
MESTATRQIGHLPPIDALHSEVSQRQRCRHGKRATDGERVKQMTQVEPWAAFSCAAQTWVKVSWRSARRLRKRGRR